MTNVEIYNQVCKIMRKGGGSPSKAEGYLADLVIRYKRDPSAFFGGWLSVLNEVAAPKGMTGSSMSQSIYRLLSECERRDGCKALCDQLGIVPHRPTPRTLVLCLADTIGA